MRASWMGAARVLGGNAGSGHPRRSPQSPAGGAAAGCRHPRYCRARSEATAPPAGPAGLAPAPTSNHTRSVVVTLPGVCCLNSHGRRRRPPPLRAPHGGAGSRAPRLRTGALSLSGHQALQEVTMGPALCAAGGARAPRGPGGHGRQREARADVPASPRCRLKREPASWCGGPALPGAERGHPLGGGSPRPPQTTPRKRSARLRPALRGPPALWALGGQHCLPAPAGHLPAPS